MKPKLGVMQDTIPCEHYNFIYRRVNGLVNWWGKFLFTYSVHDLAIACYQQGVIDAIQLLESKSTSKKDIHERD